MAAPKRRQGDRGALEHPLVGEEPVGYDSLPPELFDALYRPLVHRMAW